MTQRQPDQIRVLRAIQARIYETEEPVRFMKSMVVGAQKEIPFNRRIPMLQEEYLQ